MEKLEERALERSNRILSFDEFCDEYESLQDIENDLISEIKALHGLTYVLNKSETFLTDRYILEAMNSLLSSCAMLVGAANRRLNRINKNIREQEREKSISDVGNGGEARTNEEMKK